MKRRKYKVKRASNRKSYFKQKRRSGRKGEKVMDIVFPGLAYGGIRAPIAVAADALLQKLPLPAQVADEAGMGILSYFAFKKGKGFLKKLGKAGLYAEAYRVGDTFVSPMVQGAFGKVTGSTSNGGIFVN